MFRKASLILGAIVLIPGINYRPSVCNAWDDVKAEPPKKLERFEKVDIGDGVSPPPAELNTDPILKTPAQGVQAEKPRDDQRASNPGRARTTYSERTITVALVWLANHQMSDGSWSLQDYRIAALTRPAPA